MWIFRDAAEMMTLIVLPLTVVLIILFTRFAGGRVGIAIGICIALLVGATLYPVGEPSDGAPQEELVRTVAFLSLAYGGCILIPALMDIEREGRVVTTIKAILASAGSLMLGIFANVLIMMKVYGK